MLRPNQPEPRAGPTDAAPTLQAVGRSSRASTFCAMRQPRTALKDIKDSEADKGAAELEQRKALIEEKR